MLLYYIFIGKRLAIIVEDRSLDPIGQDIIFLAIASHFLSVLRTTERILLGRCISVAIPSSAFIYFYYTYLFFIFI